jgi:hypothetical protein
MNVAPEVHGPLEGESAPALQPATDLDRWGYVEEERFVEGVADAYDPDGVRIATDLPYRTRILVRRPANPSKASGTAFLDPLHMISEMPASWIASEWLMASGHTWIGVSVHNSSFGRLYGFSGGIEALKEQNPSRYETLQLAECDRPPRLRSYLGPSNTDSFALRWNMAMAHAQGHSIVADVAWLLRTGSIVENVERIYACGVSQTSNFWKLFLDNGWHERRRLDDGSAYIDAYLLIVSPPSTHQPTDALLVSILSESEVAGTIVQMQATAPPDRVAPRVRGYELPGAPHSMGGQSWEGGELDHQHTAEPYIPIVRAIFAAADTWVRGGPPMPHVPRIQRDPESTDGIARDELGNALGGVRVPWLEAPRAQYLPRCACGPTSGETIPLEDGVLKALYSSEGDHERLWNRAVDRLVEDRLLLPEDADSIRAHRTSVASKASGDS